MASELGITRSGESLDNVVWNILGQTYKPVQLSEASFAFDTLFPPGHLRPAALPSRPGRVHPRAGGRFRSVAGR